MKLYMGMHAFETFDVCLNKCDGCFLGVQYRGFVGLQYSVGVG